MKKNLLQSILITACVAITINANAQVALTKTLPPVGTKYYHALNMVSKLGYSQPDSGIGKTWDFSNMNLSAFIKVKDVEVISADSVPQDLKDSLPTASFFTKETANSFVTYQCYSVSNDSFYYEGSKNNNNIGKMRLLDFIFNLPFGNTYTYVNLGYRYTGSGTLKLGTHTFNDVAMFKSLPRESAPNTFTYIFYQISPYYQRIASITFDESGYLNTNVYLTGSGSTGIADVNNELSFDVYPNPASNFINLNNLPKSASITITDISGKSIYQTSLDNDKQTQINTTEWKNGVYFIQVKHNNSVLNKKVVIAK